ncbi:hypothetical protein BDR22DRAFT_919349 [Usnea florida]
MLWGASEQSNLFARIDRWKQEVVKNTLQSPTRGRSQDHEAHHMKLRSQDTRPALAEVSGNPYSRKRKASVAMADAPPRKQDKKAVMDENTEVVARRPRGRPPKNTQLDTAAEPVKQSAFRLQDPQANNAEVANSREQSLPIRAELPPSIWSPSRPASPRKPGTSPRKGQITLDKPVSEAGIDMDYLSRCDPAVHLITFRELKMEGVGIPSPVEDLFRKLQGVPLGVIPHALKSVYEEDANTPRKSKEPHSESYYLDPEKTPFPRHCLDRMKSTADLVLGKALRAQSENAHERQWGGLVNQLLCEVEAWQKWPGQVVVLNVYDFALSNSSSGVANKSPTTVTSDSKTNTPPENLGRMVDWCLGMNVDKDDMKVIQQAYSKAEPHAASLNQSLSYIKTHPLILDIELKKTAQPRDPRVQLAIWASSALLKKRIMGWDTSMPMPALAVNAHVWEYYIFFEMDDDLMMAGPYDFGTTATLSGIWTLFFRLHIITQWGKTEYRQWFRAHVVESARRYRDALNQSQS